MFGTCLWLKVVAEQPPHKFSSEFSARAGREVAAGPSARNCFEVALLGPTEPRRTKHGPQRLRRVSARAVLAPYGFFSGRFACGPWPCACSRARRRAASRARSRSPSVRSCRVVSRFAAVQRLLEQSGAQPSPGPRGRGCTAPLSDCPELCSVSLNRGVHSTLALRRRSRSGTRLWSSWPRRRTTA